MAWLCAPLLDIRARLVVSLDASALAGTQREGARVGFKEKRSAAYEDSDAMEIDMAMRRSGACRLRAREDVPGEPGAVRRPACTGRPAHACRGTRFPQNACRTVKIRRSHHHHHFLARSRRRLPRSGGLALSRAPGQGSRTPAQGAAA